MKKFGLFVLVLAGLGVAGCFYSPEVKLYADGWIDNMLSDDEDPIVASEVQTTTGLATFNVR